MALVVAVPPHAAPKRKPCSERRTCVVHSAKRKCSNSRPRWCVIYVIRKHKVLEPERSWLLRVPGCESSWNPGEADASGATGLYQFMYGTWAGTPYGRHSIFSARWQAEAAHWLYRKDGGGSEWVCQ